MDANTPTIREPAPPASGRGPLAGIGRGMVDFGIRRPVGIAVGVLALTVLFGILTVSIETDTDPENMLPGDDPVRVRNAELRDDFGTGDLIVVGVVDDDGVLTPEVFTAVAELTGEIQRLDGVDATGVTSADTVVDFPDTAFTADDVSATASALEADPLLANRIVSPDGTAIGIVVPLESEDAAGDVADAVKRLAAEDPALSDADVLVAGLPLAEDEFGRDMFVQMALLAPLAGLLIFALMLFFFRRLSLVLAAMAVAMAAVIWTMGLLIGTGFTVHIMSSMIPIFLMPIAILDSIHVLSEFFDRYPRHRNRRDTLHAVYSELFLPLTYTSLTTAVAFASLMLAPIPPVRVFGGFVALGVVAAWVLTIVFIPAFVMLIDERRFAKLLTTHVEDRGGLLTGGLRRLGRLTTRAPRSLLLGSLVVAVLAVPGVLRITVNDNPLRWFKPGTEIRHASEELNDRFPGTYNASLVLTSEEPGDLTAPATVAAIDALQERWSDIDVVGTSTSFVDVALAVDPDAASVDASIDVAAASVGGERVDSLVTSDHRRANIQLLLNDGDNTSMQSVVDATGEFLESNPLPEGVDAQWAGETYLNLVWQDKMVTGMLEAFLGTLVVVFLLMLVLFRSLRHAVFAMIPVLMAVLVVYGVAGWIGKDYDMPMAVLSALVLGIGVDFGIHFVQRYGELHDSTGSAAEALTQFFEEPARALTRNAFVIAVGFLPLFLSTLVPYLVVGAFLASLMLLSWAATLLVLPPLVLITDRGRQAPRGEAADTPEPPATVGAGADLP